MHRLCVYSSFLSIFRPQSLSVPIYSSHSCWHCHCLFTSDTIYLDVSDLLLSFFLSFLLFYICDLFTDWYSICLPHSQFYYTDLLLIKYNYATYYWNCKGQVFTWGSSDTGALGRPGDEAMPLLVQVTHSKVHGTSIILESFCFLL